MVSNSCFSLKEFGDLHSGKEVKTCTDMCEALFLKLNYFIGFFFSGILSLKFPETPTVKAASLFFVS